MESSRNVPVEILVLIAVFVLFGGLICVVAMCFIFLFLGMAGFAGNILLFVFHFYLGIAGFAGNGLWDRFWLALTQVWKLLGTY